MGEGEQKGGSCSVIVLLELEDVLEVLETEQEYYGYFCRIKDVVIIVILGSFCDLQSVKKIHEWETSECIEKFLSETLSMEKTCLCAS